MQTRRQLLASTAILATGLAGCVSSPVASESFDPVAATALDARATAQFRQGLHNRGYVDANVPDAVEVDWSMPVNRGDHTAAKSSPVPVGDETGDIVIAGDTGDVRRVGPDGTVRWRASVDPTTRGIHGTPALANETVYVGAYDGALYAFSLETGERLWRTGLGDAIGSSPVYHNGVCYIAVEYAAPSGSVAAVDAASGDLRWMDRQPTDHPHSTVCIDRETGRLAVGANDGVLYGWSFPDLERVWTVETDGPIKGPIAVHDGRGVFGSWDHHVYAVDLTDGTVVWSFEAGADVMSAPAITPDGTVYIGSHDDHLYALDAADGTEQWRFDAGGWIIGSPVATPEHVLVGSYDTRLYAVDRATGEAVWDVAGRGHATSAVLVEPDALYYAERANGETPGRLYRLVPRRDG